MMSLLRASAGTTRQSEHGQEQRFETVGSPRTAGPDRSVDRRTFRRWSLVIFLGLAVHAWAKRPNEFKAPPELTEEEIAAARDQTKSKVEEFVETQRDIPEPIPWGAIILSGLAFLVAAPFAIGAYRSTAKELRAADPTTAAPKEE